MLNRTSVVRSINTSCAPFFGSSEDSFLLRLTTANNFRIQGNASASQAINIRNNDREEVTVIRWFDDYWVYVEITFAGANTYISLSVFQGAADIIQKHQLFRAEWDDYNNDDEKHPQPHWHITANQAIERTFEEFSQDSDAKDFVSLLKEEKSKIADLNKMHFAMCGDWINSGSHTHRIDDEEKIKKWFEGLLSHLQIQLRYIK